ncbi:MAG: oligosaccharide flippase family protein [Melioribacteraceae bacterium]|nr:oligosaccharide flippase family protein [Melioribacteraceae bacterium]
MGSKREISKNISILALPKVAKFIVGIVNAKVVALLLGPLGSGIINQLQVNLQNIANFSKAGFGDGVVKLIAENKAKNELAEIREILYTYFLLVSFTTLIVFITGIILKEEVSVFIFGDASFSNYFLVAFFSLPVIILSSSSFLVLKSFKEIKYLAKSEFISVIASLLLLFPLLYFLNEFGAVLYVTLGYFVSFLAYQYFARYKVLQNYGITIYSIKNAKFNRKYFNILLSFAGATLLIIGITTFTEVYSRTLVVTNLSISSIGIYSPILKWEALFTGFILPSMTTYLYPRISESKTNSEIVSIVNDTFRIMTFGTTIFVIMVIASRKLIIPLFYTDEYLDAIEYIPYHFFGLLLTVWYKCFKQTFAPTGRLKQLVWFEMFNNVLIIGLLWYFIPIYGLWGWLLRFTVAPLVLFLFYTSYSRKAFEFHFNKENISLLIYSILSIASIISLIILDLSDFTIYLVSSIFLLGFYFHLTLSERKFILNKISAFVGK